MKILAYTVQCSSLFMKFRSGYFIIKYGRLHLSKKNVKKCDNINVYVEVLISSSNDFRVGKPFSYICIFVKN